MRGDLQWNQQCWSLYRSSRQIQQLLLWKAWGWCRRSGVAASAAMTVDSQRLGCALAFICFVVGDHRLDCSPTYRLFAAAINPWPEATTSTVSNPRITAVRHSFVDPSPFMDSSSFRGRLTGLGVFLDRTSAEDRFLKVDLDLAAWIRLAPTTTVWSLGYFWRHCYYQTMTNRYTNIRISKIYVNWIKSVN